MSTWFTDLTGFTEESPDQVRDNIRIEGDVMTSLPNGRVMAHGLLEMPSLAELRQRVAELPGSGGGITVREMVGDVQALHCDAGNADALFQVASQFNLLEMVSQDTTPEEGIAIYQFDRTQGPACAIAAGAGTIYRNYFVPLDGQVGQSESNQVNCLADIGKSLGNEGNQLWQMRNGYALPTADGLALIADRLAGMSEDGIDDLRCQLRVGVQWNTEVTLMNAGHKVTQVYCSALPVAYTGFPAEHWRAFACLVLEAAYEATICAGILNAANTGNNQVFLTMLGGGAFGNRIEWIADAMASVIERYRQWALDIVIVSFRGPNESLAGRLS
ncbi:MAG: hypothetical protein ACFHX7_07860 [Pseudomonadota bacterium]